MNLYVLRIFLVLSLLVSLAACSSDDDSEAIASMQVAGADGEALEIPEGATVETHTPEDRSAVLTILKASVSRDETAPYKAELVRAFDAEIYRDVDPGDGPGFWIMKSEIEDADGNVLWSDRENSTFQLLELLEIILDQQSTINLSAFQLYTFVSSQYAQLVEFAVRVPTGVPNAKDYVLRIPNEDGDDYEVFRVDIAELVAGAQAPAYPGEVETIYENAPPAEALDIVILGDGYPDEDREKFALDTQAVAEELIESEPFRSYAGQINVHRVWTASNERGAGYDCTGNPLLDGACADALRDSVYGTTFVITAIGDIYNLDIGDTSDRVAMPIEVARMYEVAALANYDEIILVSNTRRRSGFAGLYVSVVTSFDRERVQFPDVAVHELGHSFGVLGDEYQVMGDPCLFNEPRVPLPANIAPAPEGNEFKWDHWFAEATPIPTPGSQRASYPVGAYEGAYNCDYLYRPSHDCKMNSSEELDFCRVCSEQITRRMHSVLDPTRPVSPTIERSENGVIFTLPAYAESDELWAIAWTLDGNELGTGSTLELTPGQLNDDWSTLEASIGDVSGFVRIDDVNLNQTYSWQVRK